ncbi:MAG: ABC transporter ATP-binding protein [Bernardetiaceae bacterium]
MSEVVLRVENLYKQYRLGVVNRAALRDDLRSAWAWLRGQKDPRDALSGNNQLSQQTDGRYVWALQDINFEVKRGEILGIIGKNGAGKSTLLKILSKTTAPTRGQVKVKGRIASLLEVGTGFHPELTGRENIYLNGLILGMKRHEITRKLDEIVDFAGVEKYLDTPTKRYSSGMTVRLGFAVAAHLEPDILIVDEVLAVGDAEFQKKAIGKMQEVSQGGGRTVLFVSHNMGSVKALCNRSLLLSSGQVVDSGETEMVISTYLSLNKQRPNGSLADTPRQGSGQVMFKAVKVLDFHNEQPIDWVREGQDIVIRLYLSVSAPSRSVLIALGIDDQNEYRISFMSNELLGKEVQFNTIGKHHIDFVVKRFPFVKGRYYMTLFCSTRGVISDWLSHAYVLEVTTGNVYSTGREVISTHGVVLLDYDVKKTA